MHSIKMMPNFILHASEKVTKHEESAPYGKDKNYNKASFVTEIVH